MESGARLSLPDPGATDLERRPLAPTSGLLEALPTELLGEILLRVASPVDLARASAACVSFRRLIADHAFHRRYCSIHPPLLLGIVTSEGFLPAEAPHPSAVLAGAVSFSFDYLPRSTRWGWDDAFEPCDARDGRVLFERSRGQVDWELLVCDPLSRRYLLLPPPITNDLLASIGITYNSGSSFIRSGGTEEDTSFNVINWMQSSSSLWVFIFSSDSGCWSVSTSISWGDLGLAQINQYAVLDRHISGPCTDDCFYWKLNDMSTLIKLDMSSMQFCTIGLPPGHEKREIVIVESEESGVAMFSTVQDGTSVDYYTFSQNGNGMSHEWHLRRTIPLPAHYTCGYNIGGPTEGYIFIECIPNEPYPTYPVLFLLEINSFNIERVGSTSFSACGVYPYFGFPPSMSPRRI